MDLSKIEAGKLVLESRPVAVDAILANVASILSEQAREKGLRMEIVAEDVPRNLAGDAHLAATGCRTMPDSTR